MNLLARRVPRFPLRVMAGLDPAIHAVTVGAVARPGALAWMAGSSPAMTAEG